MYYETGNSGEHKMNFKNLTINNNKASSGGGVFIHHLPSTIIDILFTHIQMNENKADIGGNIRYIGELSKDIFLKNI